MQSMPVKCTRGVARSFPGPHKGDVANNKESPGKSPGLFHCALSVLGLSSRRAPPAVDDWRGGTGLSRQTATPTTTLSRCWPRDGMTPNKNAPCESRGAFLFAANRSVGRPRQCLTPRERFCLNR